MADTDASPKNTGVSARSPGEVADHGGEIEVDIIDDADSAIDDKTISNFTASIASSVLNYPVEHGRRYHAYRSGAYPMPNDEGEIERLDLLHSVVTKSIGNMLYLAPIDAENPGRVLDIGAGTGIWAMEFGDTHPNAEILGNDLSPIQPSWVPPNVKFEVDDVEGNWVYERKFNFIFCRYMAVSILDWPRLISQIYENLEPGGWVELQDFNLRYYSEDGSLPGDARSLKRVDELIGASKSLGREACPGPLQERWVRDASFANVTTKLVKLPCGPWPKDSVLKEIGMLNLAQLLEGIEGFSLRLFTGVLGYSPEALQLLLEQVRKEMKDQRLHMIYNMWV